MEKKQWDEQNNANPQHDWQMPEEEGQWQLAEYDNDDSTEMFVSGADETDEPRYADREDANEDDDDDENEDVNEDDDEPGDWGHTDPAEGNNPFPDPMDPSGPGSAV